MTIIMEKEFPKAQSSKLLNSIAQFFVEFQETICWTEKREIGLPIPHGSSLL